MHIGIPHFVDQPRHAPYTPRPALAVSRTVLVPTHGSRSLRFLATLAPGLPRLLQRHMGKTPVDLASVHSSPNPERRVASGNYSHEMSASPVASPRPLLSSFFHKWMEAVCFGTQRSKRPSVLVSNAARVSLHHGILGESLSMRANFMAALLTFLPPLRNRDTGGQDRKRRIEVGTEEGIARRKQRLGLEAGWWVQQRQDETAQLFPWAEHYAPLLARLDLVAAIHTAQRQGQRLASPHAHSAARALCSRACARTRPCGVRFRD
ncbi:hypothetical protein B0H14DRAFT_3536221 [Mycena olivaceomarginata]|nr:hypothetical protein B0H14DRAFT_3536221 [Mycena olivaceomarginata]